MKIVLSPYSARLSSGKRNPKNYPFWGEVVSRLNTLGYEVIQLGVAGEERIEGVSQFIQNWPLKKLRPLIEECHCFLSVDTWLPHFVFSERLNKRGIVVFSQSDPVIFGHPENINLLKSREYLRPLQFQDWNQAEYNEAAFVSPDVIIDAVTSLKPAHRTRIIPRGVSVAV